LLLAHRVGGIHDQVAHACNEVLQVGPDQAQRDQLEEPAGDRAEVTLVSNIQMMKGINRNMIAPLIRWRIETIPAGGRR